MLVVLRRLSKVAFVGLLGLVALIGVQMPVSTALADLTITMGGDVNFNKNRQEPLADGSMVFGRKVSFAETTRGIRNLIDGDLNFANIETVVTDDRHLPAQRKAFVFRSHPNAILHLMDIGFNLFSLANNHSHNHGSPGLGETLTTMDRFVNEGHRITYAGIERDRRDFEQVRIAHVNGYKVALAAVTITDPTFRAGNGSVGVLDYRNGADYDLALRSLRETQADLKILSIHAGTELRVKLDPGQQEKFERALSEGDVDLVIGHHPHVVRPISNVNGRVILYSLGNYLMLGAANIGKRGVGVDYGLFARAHFAWDASAGRLKMQAIEAVPITDMHLDPKRLSVSASAERVRNLNQLSAGELGHRKAVEFSVRTDGTGVACFDTGLPYSARALAVCK
ncbi:MAG: CapA family protein [Bdellovibrionales bacterium]|jgi:poly-gamma-glutamate synthesis protein (capsule biosynthesis protein)|nr:CapA family protein [Bdellovibrionales bacterium]